jgi:hypothetical protein
MHRLVSLCLVGLLTAVLIGCESSSSSPSSTAQPKGPEITSNQQLKDRLNGVAQSGFAGSALAGMPEMVKKLGKPDLDKDMEELQTAKSPEAIKTIAKRMADKVP